jgi:predicted extracellular nuclease
MVLLGFPLGVQQAAAVTTGSGTVSLTALGTAVTENFNTLATTGPASTLPTGWFFDETNTNGNNTYSAGTGSGTTGDTYSFGAAGNTERAFGTLRSNTLTPIVGAGFTNNTGTTITKLDVRYTGEQWRIGVTSRNAADHLDFQYSTTATSIASGSFIGIPAFNFNSPIVNGTAGALDGNNPLNRSVVSGSITGISVANGATVFIRWLDFDITSSDDGLGIDDFSITPLVGDAAPAVTATSPLAGATSVAVSSNVSVTFSEPVNVTGNWYSISCATSGAHTAGVSGGPTVFTLDPSADFASSESCTVTVFAANVSDQDTDDPPDQMGANFVFSFTTVEQFACGDPRTYIHTVQGSGAASPIVGTKVDIEGIVVGASQGTGSFGGFYVEEADSDSDADPATSEGIFVLSAAPTVALGDRVRARGTVTEFVTSSGGVSSSLTELTGVGSVLVCSTGNTVTPTPITLPVAALSDFERYEGMLVTFAQTLTATETFTLGRFGEVRLAANGRLYTPTAVVAPGAPANALEQANDRRSFVLDDGNNSQNIDPTAQGYYPTGGLSASNTLRSGYTTTGLSGVFDERFGAYRVQARGPISFNSSTNPRTSGPDPVGGNVKVGSANVLNFFNGDGSGGGFPTSRGATTPSELARQEAKIVSELAAIGADIFGLMEIENDSGPSSAIAELVASLNAAVGAGTYSYINTGIIGTDEIKVALIYKPSAVTPVGAWQILTSAIDTRFIDTKNRPTLAQTFVHNATGAKFTVAVNHLKSKGSACDDVGDPDLGDGQGNCNQTRTNAAAAIVDWLNTDPTASGSPDFLLIGDMNAYAKEDPITQFISGGYTDLVALYEGPTAYSYVFDGQAGYIDHALASAHLGGAVSGVGHWHNNADEPIVLDYNVEFKTAGQVTSFYSSGPYRASDHDPVVVGFDLQDTTPPQWATFPPDVTRSTGPAATTCGTFVSDADLGTPTATDNAPGAVTITRSAVPSGNIFPVGVTTITYTATDASGNTATATQKVTVVDDTPPAITAPLDAVYELAIMVPAANPTDANAIDNCGPVTLTVTESSNGGAGSPANPLVIIRMYTATDGSGNSASATQTITVMDITPPLITGAPTTSPNANHWWNTPVTVHFTCADNSGNVTCPADVTLSGDGADQSVTGTATDAAGNTATTTVGDIDIDQTKPTITFTGAATYTVSQTVNITCAAADTLSGLSTAVCPGASGAAFTFGLGSHTLSASATDAAGNASTATFTFTVTDDTASVCTLVQQFVSNSGVATSLCAKLDAAAAARARGSVNGHDNQIQAFINEVNAQRGKSISDANANTLISLAGGL